MADCSPLCLKNLILRVQHGKIRVCSHVGMSIDQRSQIGTKSLNVLVHVVRGNTQLLSFYVTQRRRWATSREIASSHDTKKCIDVADFSHRLIQSMLKLSSRRSYPARSFAAHRASWRNRPWCSSWSRSEPSCCWRCAHSQVHRGVHSLEWKLRRHSGQRLHEWYLSGKLHWHLAQLWWNRERQLARWKLTRTMVMRMIVVVMMRSIVLYSRGLPSCAIWVYACSYNGMRMWLVRAVWSG